MQKSYSVNLSNILNASKQMFALLVKSPAENAEVILRALSRRGIETH